MGCGVVAVEMTAAAVVIPAETAAETAAAMIDSMVSVGCVGSDGDVVTARTCDGREVTARRSGVVGVCGDGSGGGDGGDTDSCRAA